MPENHRDLGFETKRFCEMRKNKRWPCKHLIDVQVDLVRLDHKDNKVQLDFQGLPVHRVMLGVMVLKVVLVLQVRKAMPALQASQVSQVLQAALEPVEQKEKVAQLDHQVIQAHRDVLVQLGHPVIRDQLVPLVPLVILVLQALLVSQVRMVCMITTSCLSL